MDIAAMAMNFAQYKLQTQVSTAVLDKVMDTQKVQAESLINQMSNSVPSFGHTLDTYA